MAIVKIILAGAIILKRFKSALQCGFDSLQLKGSCVLNKVTGWFAGIEYYVWLMLLKLLWF